MSRSNPSTWQHHLAELGAAQLSLVRHAPYRDFGLIPCPGASEQLLVDTERKLARALPTSYRAFLAQHNGWKRFYDGASLLGCVDLADSTLQRTARELFAAAASPSACSPTNFRSAPRQLLVFGADKAGTTLFAFDLDTSDLAGEPKVIAWLGELGLKYPNFSEFLAALTQLCSAELEAFQIAAEPPPSALRRTNPAARSDLKQSESLRKAG